MQQNHKTESIPIQFQHKLHDQHTNDQVIINKSK